MAQKEVRGEGAEKVSPLNMMPAQFAEMGKKRIEDLVEAQTELFEKFQESNKQWLARLQLEANLASDLASKLTSVRSIPDAMTACQEWSGEHVKMMAEDGKHLFADVQKFMETGTRLLSNGWLHPGKGSGINT
jgi:hypothetical protein